MKAFPAFFLLMVLLTSPHAFARDTSEPFDEALLPQILKANCTYLGNGYGMSGTQINERGFDTTIYWVNLSFQCKKDYTKTEINPEGYVAAKGQRPLADAVEAFGKKLVYNNMKKNSSCQAILANGSAVSLTEDPANPKYWEHPSPFLFVNYSANFLCRQKKK